MKVKQLVGQLEHTFGRKSHSYLISLLNDGLDEIAQTALSNTEIASTPLVKDQRWYDLLTSSMIDVFRVEILDSKLKWRELPRSTTPPEIGDEE
tara:strand:- start:12 stop:293 length:282 start_codon:yes stop_codon:yes gene_type:complete